MVLSLLLLQLHLFHHPVVLRSLLLLPHTHASHPVLLMAVSGWRLFWGRRRLVGQLPRGLAHQRTRQLRVVLQRGGVQLRLCKHRRLVLLRIQASASPAARRLRRNLL